VYIRWRVVAAVVAAAVVEDVVEVKEDAVVEVMEVEEHEGVAEGEEATAEEAKAEEAEAEAAEDDLAHPNGSESSGASEMVVEKADPQQGLSTQHPQHNLWGGAVTTLSMTPGSTPLVRRVGNLTGRPWCWTVAGYDSI